MGEDEDDTKLRQKEDKSRSRRGGDGDESDDGGDDDRRSSSSKRKRSSKKSKKHHHASSSSSRKRDRKKKRSKKKKRRHRDDDDDSGDEESDASSDASSSSSSSSSEDDSGSGRRRKKSRKKEKRKKQKKSAPSSAAAAATTTVVNERLLAKLQARGETLEERKERRARKRAAHIAAKFGYTAEDNPFHDPNLHETFTWKKRNEKVVATEQQTKDTEDPATGAAAAAATSTGGGNIMGTLNEIEKVRKRRKEREVQHEEMERIRAEESRMRELEHYDEWQMREEEFHLQQQKQRSAIRLVEGREKPIDVLAKNIILFGLSELQEKDRKASENSNGDGGGGDNIGGTVKYKEKYNAIDALDNLNQQIEEPAKLISLLKLVELEELVTEINHFRTLERDTSTLQRQQQHSAAMSGNADGTSLLHDGDNANNTILQYWDALYIIVQEEIEILKTGGDKGGYATTCREIQKIFHGQNDSELEKMKLDILQDKLPTSGVGGSSRNGADPGNENKQYWTSVLQQLHVHLAKSSLTKIHQQMLVRQIEKLEKKRQELKQQKADEDGEDVKVGAAAAATGQEQGGESGQHNLPDNIASPDFGNNETSMTEENEYELLEKQYAWSDRYRPRKPRYFNRVKTGYDWNRYNQSHYDHDNPPPKIVQGYKFNIFYPDLIDPTKTPTYKLEKCGDDPNEEFCLIRFSAGPPYQDVAFKIINREWNISRKRGFKCTFERGVLSLYVNFKTHWYRR